MRVCLLYVLEVVSNFHSKPTILKKWTRLLEIQLVKLRHIK